MPTQEFINARNAAEVTAAFGVKITFPAYNGLPEKILYWGTMNFELPFDEEEYFTALASLPQTTHQLGSGQDTFSFDVSNAEGALYDELAPYDDVFEDAQIVIKECYQTEEGIFESDIIFTGKVESILLTDQNALLNIQGVSDMSATGFPVGGRILTYRHCGARFNVNGLLDPVFDPCGWQTAQGGNPTFCTHIIEGVDGCADHNNVHRYFAVPQMADAEPIYIGSSGGALGGGNGTGFEYEVENTCFTERMFVPMIGGKKKSIADVKQNEWLRGFRTNPKDTVTGAEVLFIHRHKVTDLLEIEFQNGEVHETRPEHCYYTGKDRYTAAGHLVSCDPVAVYDMRAGIWRFELVAETRKKVKPDWVFNLISTTGNYFVQSEKAASVIETEDLIFAVSNSKYFNIDVRIAS